MIAVIFGILSAISLGVADFLANRNAVRLGADRTLCGMLAVGTVGLTLVGLGLGVAPPHDVIAVSLIVLHGIGLALALLLFFAALARGPITVVAPIVGAHPVLVVAFAAAVGRVPDRLETAAMAAIVVGVILVGTALEPSGSSATDAGRQPATDPIRQPPVTLSILALAGSASVIYAIAVIAGQEGATRSDGFVALWFGRAIGFLLILALLALQRRDLRFWQLSWRRQGLIAAHGTLDTLGFFLLLAGGMTANPEFTAVVSSTFSVVTVVLACILLGERMNRLQVLGLALIVGGVAALGYSNP